MKNQRKGFLERLFSSRYFGRVIVPVVVVLIGVVMLIIAPWQTRLPAIEQTPDTIARTPEPAPEPVPEEITETPSPTPDPTPSPTPTPDVPPTNPITGELMDEELSKKRPFAVAIGNTAEALPQKGVGAADILCEYLVEGATRFMAIYQDVTEVGEIGGIRSLRTSSMQIAAGFDAIFTHWIGRTYDNVETFGNPVTRYNTIDASSGGVGYRGTGKAAPHNGMTNGERLAKAIPSSFRTERNPRFDSIFAFTEDGKPEGGQPAKTVTVSYYKNYKSTIFTLGDDNKYYVKQFNRDLTDGNDGKLLSFTNILIIKTYIETGYNPSGHSYIGAAGNGEGYFVCGGQYVDIKWSRPNLEDPYKFTLADGKPLELGVGKTFLCIIDNGETPVFE